MADVFISYRHADRLLALKLYDHLSAHGRSVFLDRKRLEPGARWEGRILAELETAGCVVVLWSQASLRSEWVRNEATRGLERRRLVQASLEPVHIPEPFGSLQAIDLTGWRGDPTPELAALTAAIDGVIRLPVGAPRLVHEELDALVDRLDTTAPEKKLGENLLLGTWNIRALGGFAKKWTAGPRDPTRRDDRSLTAIAEIIRRFDLIVLQEVKAPFEAFNTVLSKLGDEWGALVLEPSQNPRASGERTAFVFDTRRVIPHGRVDRLGLDDEFRPGLFFDVPYAAYFRTRLGTPSSTFGLLTLRMLYGRPAPDEDVRQLRATNAWLRQWAEEERAFGRSLLFLGDFGSDRRGDPVYDAFVQDRIAVPDELQAVPRTIFAPGHPSAFVDHVAWMKDDDGQPIMSLRYEGRAGYFDFVGTVHREDAKTALAWSVSDHYPIWIELGTRATRGASKRPR